MVRNPVMALDGRLLAYSCRTRLNPRVGPIAADGSLSSVSVNRWWDQVRAYVRSAPLTYTWLAVLLATTLVQHQLTERTLRRLLQSTSTNLHHLASDPLRVLFQSLLWIDGSYWWPYLVIFTVFLAPAERWLGHLRWAVLGLLCHLGATYLSEGYLYWTIQQAAASPRLIDARDVGVSYFVVGIVGVLFYRVPRRWRWGYLAAVGGLVVGGLLYQTNFTSLGHLCALLLGLACYPLTRRRRARAAYTPAVAISDDDLGHLRRCVELAREALDAGDQPFGSLLVDAKGVVRFEDRNRTKDGDSTRHPEFEIARWSTSHLTPGERAAATVYTSGEHCPMCAAAHAWVGLGRIVYAVSTAQMVGWLQMWGVTASPVAPLPISTIAPGVPVDGPAPELAEEMKAMYEVTFKR
jgi:tRNA(Arg) A34 adenosine deaminase TadA